jgi:hypothetical protein
MQLAVMLFQKMQAYGAEIEVNPARSMLIATLDELPRYLGSWLRDTCQ